MTELNCCDEAGCRRLVGGAGSANRLLATTLRCSQSQAGIECRATYLQFRDSLFDLLDLHFAEAFDLEKRLACSSVDRLSSVSKIFFISTKSKENPHSNSVVAIGLELCDVCCSHTYCS